MDIWSKRTLNFFLFPGGALLAVALVLLKFVPIPLATSAVLFYYYAVFLIGGILAWRFRSSRVLFILAVMFAAHQAIAFFTEGTAASPIAAQTSLEVTALLLPLNFIFVSFVRERGPGVPVLTARLSLLFLESVFVAFITNLTKTPAFLHPVFLSPRWFSWIRLPQPAVLIFAVAFVILLVRFLLQRKPVESGLFWALVTVFWALQEAVKSDLRFALVGTAGLMLVSAIVENSYILAYHDELTSLPSRRAFNDALIDLQEPYAIAVVDIDHFKKFNDTYGHDTGDQVLCMVAAQLARVSGGGKAFRIGGEEFTILFPGKSLKDVLVHLELLRVTIQNSVFHFRLKDRRQRPEGPDRRRPVQHRVSHSRPPATTELSVTVSIGVAGPSVKLQQVEQVIQAADKALYHAKEAGRNKVAVASSTPARTASTPSRSPA